MVAKAIFEDIRSLGFAGISGAYATVGSATTHRIRSFCISNNTQGDLLFSLDGSSDQMFVPASSFRLYDIQSNINPQKDDKYVLPIGSQFYVKQITAPTSGSVYIECMA